MTLDGWQDRLTRMVAREVRRHRDRQKLSAQQLADRTADLGMPIPRSVLANLESGRRDTVSVAEVLVLAAVLGVAPSELICPAGYDEQVEILPGRMVEPLLALRWIDGELAIDLSGPDVAFAAPDAGEESGPRLLETHAGLIDQVWINDGEAARAAAAAEEARGAQIAAVAAVHEAERATGPGALDEAKKALEHAVAAATRATSEAHYRTQAATAYRQTAAQSLRLIRAEMARRGMLLPALPPSVDPDYQKDGGLQ